MGVGSSRQNSSPVVSLKLQEDQGSAPDSKPKKKICCACPETKKLRDECIVEHGEPACEKWIEAHRKCLRAEGFNVLVVALCNRTLVGVFYKSPVTKATTPNLIQRKEACTCLPQPTRHIVQVLVAGLLWWKSFIDKVGLLRIPNLLVITILILVRLMSS